MDETGRVVRALFLGDVVGESGIAAVEAALPALARDRGADFVVVNGENAAGGFGVTESSADRLLAAGADVVTTGNHVWEKRDFWPYMDRESRLLRPANYPPSTPEAPIPGRGFGLFEKNGVKWGVLNLQGRELMSPIDCPFRAGRRAVEELRSAGALVLVDFHAESTREKEALGWYLDGSVAAVVGTHTHVQSADERIQPKGSAYMTDLGMSGPLDGVIGMKANICADRNRTQIPFRMECAEGRMGLRGALVDVDASTGLAVSIERIAVDLESL